MREVGRYILQQELGRGATAQVFLAVPKGEPDHRVALKVFHPGFWDQEMLRRRAMSEFRMVSALKHPNLVQVLEALWDVDPPAVVLQYVDGVSLEAFQGRLPYVLPELAALIMIEILSGLEYAHAEGVVHRDLKPANILVGSDGSVLISDFGLAKMADVSRLTLSGTVLGSPDYMSPEQARGDLATNRSDLFSAAAIFYFLVTGTKPFARHSPLATLAAVNDCQYEPPQRRNPKLGSELCAVIRKGLSKDPAARFQSATEFKQTLVSYLEKHGLHPAEFNLKRWIRHPSETVLDALNTLSVELSKRCEKEIHAGHLNEALETLSYLGTVAPESAALIRLMEELERRRNKAQRGRKIWRLAVGSAATAAVMAMAYFGIAVWQKKNVEQETFPVTQERDIQAISPAPVASPLPTIAAVVDETAARVAKAPVRFDVRSGVRVFWDGEEIDPSLPLSNQTLGFHRIRLVKDGAKPIVQRVLVRADEPTVIRVR